MDGDEGVTWSVGTNTGGKISSSGVVSHGVAVVGVILVLVLEETSSDNMGNKESSKGVLLTKEGTSLINLQGHRSDNVKLLVES